MLLTLVAALSFAIQLTEAEEVVDGTPGVTDWLTLSMFMVMLMLANVLTLGSPHREIRNYAPERAYVL